LFSWKEKKMSEKFFEMLRERAELPEQDPPYSLLERLAFFRGRNAIIEALKKMMVGEPICARLRHRGRISATPYTVVEFKPGHQFVIGGLEHIGADGKEVMVFVVCLS